MRRRKRRRPSDTGVICLAVGLCGLTVLVGSVFMILAVVRHGEWCPGCAEDESL
ncbi:hypothetical protein [Streptomyces sp. NPDC057002]|uniref:hypothetical protein n=1 Tax=Streptomyces sp. NPDC057002 TaxID=3345992 RepID=UPI00363C54C6